MASPAVLPVGGSSNNSNMDEMQTDNISSSISWTTFNIRNFIKEQSDLQVRPELFQTIELHKQTTFLYIFCHILHYIMGSEEKKKFKKRKNPKQLGVAQFVAWEVLIHLLPHGEH